MKAIMLVVMLVMGMVVSPPVQENIPTETDALPEIDLSEWWPGILIPNFVALKVTYEGGRADRVVLACTAYDNEPDGANSWEFYRQEFRTAEIEHRAMVTFENVKRERKNYFIQCLATDGVITDELDFWSMWCDTPLDCP